VPRCRPTVVRHSAFMHRPHMSAHRDISRSSSHLVRYSEISTVPQPLQPISRLSRRRQRRADCAVILNLHGALSSPVIRLYRYTYGIDIKDASKKPSYSTELCMVAAEHFPTCSVARASRRRCPSCPRANVGSPLRSLVVSRFRRQPVANLRSAI
jgi:hypothetical protein